MGNANSAEMEEARRHISETTMETVSVFQREWETNMRNDILMTMIREASPADRYDDSAGAPPPVPAGLFQYTLMEGWMSKRGDVNPGWKVRYFRAVVLEGGYVRVTYHTDADADSPPLGQMPCAGYEALAFGPKDYSDILGQKDVASGEMLAPAQGEKSLWYGIKIVPADVYNTEGKRLWWLRVSSKEEQAEWVEALRQLTRITATSAAQPATRRSSMPNIFRESDSAARLSAAPKPQVAPHCFGRDLPEYLKVLRRVFTSTFIKTRKYFSIESIVLAQLRYPPGSESRLLEETLEPVLKREIFDRMTIGGTQKLREGPKEAGSKDDSPDRLVSEYSSASLEEGGRLLDEISWCRMRGLPPLPLQQLYQRLTSKQHAAAEPIVRPAAANLWQAMQKWTAENYMGLYKSVQRERKELLDHREALLKAMKLSPDSSQDVPLALACAHGGDAPPAEEAGVALSLICKFLQAAAPRLAALQDGTFDELCQANLHAFTALYKVTESAVGTAAAPGPLTVAMLKDLDVVQLAQPPSRRASNADDGSGGAIKLGSSTPADAGAEAEAMEYVTATKDWFRDTAERLCTVSQPRPGEEVEVRGDATSSSLLWNSRLTLWTLFSRTMSTPGLLLEILDVQYAMGGASPFDSLFCANLNSIREAAAAVLHTWQDQVLVQMAQLRDEGMIARLGGGIGGEQSKLKVACKVLHAARREVLEGAVKSFEALMRRQNQTMLLMQLEHELSMSLLPALRKECKNASPDTSRFTVSVGTVTSLWNAQAVVEAAGKQTVALVVAALVNDRMNSGGCSVVDRLDALYQRVKPSEDSGTVGAAGSQEGEEDEDAGGVSEAEFGEGVGVGSSVDRGLSELHMEGNNYISEGGGPAWGGGSTAEYDSDDEDREDVIDDGDFIYARQSHLVHIQAAQALRKQPPGEQR